MTKPEPLFPWFCIGKKIPVHIDSTMPFEKTDPETGKPFDCHIRQHRMPHGQKVMLVSQEAFDMLRKACTNE